MNSAKTVPLAPSCPDEPNAIEQEKAVERILASRHFAKAPLLSAFLRFIWKRATAPEIGRPTEVEIGVQVFHREPGYDPGDDNIVRNYARQLRRRLEDYYLQEGRGEHLRLTVPRGAYLPIFVDAHSAPATVEPVAGEAESQKPRLPQELPHSTARLASPARLLALAGALVLLVACLFTWNQFRYRFLTPDALLWHELFQSGRTTYVVPADTSFVMVQEMEKRAIPLSEYETWAGVELYNHVYTSYLKAQKYTSVLDLQIVSRILNHSRTAPERLVIRAARDVKLSDLNSGNAILLGSSFSNPWVSIVEPQLNFQFHYSPTLNRGWIANLHPIPHELPAYTSNWSSYTHVTYALLALEQNPSQTGRVLVIEGLDGAGTESASNFLFSNALRPVLAAARRQDGSLRNFEVLLETTSVGSHATQTQIVAERTSN